MNDKIFSITTQDLQNEATIALGRELDENEVDKAIKLLQYGLGENLILIYKSIFNEII